MGLWKSHWNLLEIIFHIFFYSILHDFRKTLQNYVPQVSLRQYKNKFSVRHLENKFLKTI